MHFFHAEMFQRKILKIEISFFLFLNLFILFLAVLGPHSCTRALPSCGERGLPRCGARASHCGSPSRCGAQAVGARASVVVAHGPSCSVACGIFPHQGSNPCLLHWQADPELLRHQGSPLSTFLKHK